MKTFLTLLISTVIASASHAATSRVGQEGNGGGGIARNGSYMTFFSAGVKINPTPKVASEVPTLNDLIKLISSTDVMDANQAGTWLSFVIPSERHQYFDVDEAYFTPQVELRLKNEYARVAKIPLNQVALFAITDTKTGETYLMPDFYKLKKPSEKMAILFHENAWLLCPSCEYKQILKTEMLFQSYIEDSHNTQKGYALAASFSPNSSLRYAFEQDKKMGIIIDGRILRSDGNQMQLTVGNLLGDEYINCLGSSADDCQMQAVLGLAKVHLLFPSSMLSLWLSENVSSNKARVDVSGDGECDAKFIIRKMAPNLIGKVMLFEEIKMGQLSPKMSATSDRFSLRYHTCNVTVQIMLNSERGI